MHLFCLLDVSVQSLPKLKKYRFCLAIYSSNTHLAIINLILLHASIIYKTGLYITFKQSKSFIIATKWSNEPVSYARDCGFESRYID